MAFYKTRLFWLGVIALIALAGSGVRALLERPTSLRGSAINPPQPAPAISALPATTPSGSYSLSDSSGKVVLIFFGYTTCPDVCPTTLAEMKRVLGQVNGGAETVQVVFISVDPQRDTPEKLSGYLRSFDPSFIGVTGSEAQLDPVWKGYGVFRQISNGQSAAGYLVDHSAFVYVIDRQGRLRETFPYGAPVADIAADARALARE